VNGLELNGEAEGAVTEREDSGGGGGALSNRAQRNMHALDESV
jgi:hypothetical protein